MVDSFIIHVVNVLDIIKIQALFLCNVGMSECTCTYVGNSVASEQVYSLGGRLTSHVRNFLIKVPFSEVLAS